MMMNYNLSLILFLIIGSLFFTSCFEIIEEVNMNTDGSGNAILTINANESKEKLANIIEMGTFQGKKIPSRYDIDDAITQAKSILTQAKGISNVKTDVDYEEFIFVISADFMNTMALNNAINTLAKYFNRSTYGLQIEDNFAYQKNKFTRLYNYKTYPEQYNRLPTLERMTLETARYRSIHRFPKEIKSFSNKTAKLSRTKKAIMFQASIGSLMNGNKTIRNELNF